MPEGATEGIRRGMYKFQAARAAEGEAARATVRQRGDPRRGAAGAGHARSAVRRRRRRLERDQLQGAATATAATCERWNRLHPGRAGEGAVRHPVPSKDAPGVFVAASDYVKVLPDSIGRWVPRPLVALGTDGFGRSETARPCATSSRSIIGTLSSPRCRRWRVTRRSMPRLRRMPSRP